MSVKKQPEARQGWETDVPKLSLQLKSPFCVTAAASLPLLWHRYQREFLCTAWSNTLGKNGHIGELYINHYREWQSNKAVSYW